MLGLACTAVSTFAAESDLASVRLDRLQGVFDRSAGLAPLSRDVVLTRLPALAPSESFPVPPPEGGFGRTTLNAAAVGLREVTYQNRNGYAVFEGDMVLGDVTEAASHQLDSDFTISRSYNQPFAQFYWIDTSVWYDGSIPFCFQNGFSETQQQLILAQIAIFNAAVGDVVKFQPDGTGADRLVCPGGDLSSRSRVRIAPWTQAEVCQAQVGRIVGKEQWVWLHPSCDARNILHELSHAAGMLHEHTRSDRDQWVTVQWDNIPHDEWADFSQTHPLPTENIGQYDFLSIMHYRLSEFAIANGRPTLVVKAGVTAPPVSQIGTRDELSPLDIAGLKAKYIRAHQLSALHPLLPDQ
ncbi:M12 family metallopeptidase [Solimonas terrae]|uniref:Peptidase M12A domain-containing protein n=1 Tax=Solimonas terrae TaxID=1396819 RepID=A0A6M2BLK3_9GAMM|nr:M12 family metallopeptidase [Solimonas terrae]NGY03348.1 hypothetical protein [Solimonas terrae]